jgi:HB1, ASXL, restriction endonuclease HTH domain
MSKKLNQAKKPAKTTSTVKREREMSADELSAKRTEEARKADEATANGTATPTKASPEAPAEKPAKAPKAKAEPKAKKVSALDAAANVLVEQGKPMNCQELIEEMSRKGYWTSPNGATPHATLYAAVLREIKVKGKDARFTKTERGKFAMAK